MRKFFMKENTGGGMPRLATEVTESIVKNELRVTFLAEVDTHTPKHAHYNAPLYEGDIVEILLTLGEPNVYLEVEVNEIGALYAVKIVNRDGVGDILIEKLDEGYVSADVSTDGGVWRTDVVVYLDKLEELGYNKNDKKVNYMRQNFVGDRLELYSVSPTMCGKFHIINAFFNV